ncbi:MAG: hypothetical protein AAB819_00075 [Patescibacteria group bacterium]
MIACKESGYYHLPLNLIIGAEEFPELREGFFIASNEERGENMFLFLFSPSPSDDAV